MSKLLQLLHYNILLQDNIFKPESVFAPFVDRLRQVSSCSAAHKGLLTDE